MLALRKPHNQLGAKTLTNLWPSNDRSSRSEDTIAPFVHAQVCTGKPTRMQAQVTSVEGSARSETAEAPSTPWGRRRREQNTKHSVNTQGWTSRMTRGKSWYHRASSYAAGQSKALTKPRMRQESGLPGSQPMALIP